MSDDGGCAAADSPPAAELNGNGPSAAAAAAAASGASSSRTVSDGWSTRRGGTMWHKTEQGTFRNLSSRLARTLSESYHGQEGNSHPICRNFIGP